MVELLAIPLLLTGEQFGRYETVLGRQLQQQTQIGIEFQGDRADIISIDDGRISQDVCLLHRLHHVIPALVVIVPGDGILLLAMISHEDIINAHDSSILVAILCADIQHNHG